MHELDIAEIYRVGAVLLPLTVGLIWVYLDWFDYVVQW